MDTSNMSTDEIALRFMHRQEKPHFNTAKERREYNSLPKEAEPSHPFRKRDEPLRPKPLTIESAQTADEMIAAFRADLEVRQTDILKKRRGRITRKPKRLESKITFPFLGGQKPPSE